MENAAKITSKGQQILDTAPAQLLAIVRYKVKETGGEFVEAPTRKLKPSQHCPLCWTLKKKALSDRCHACNCGCSMPGDVASGLMIKWALVGFGQELAEAGNAAKLLLTEA